MTLRAASRALRSVASRHDDDDETIALARIRGLHEKLSIADRELLTTCLQRPVDVEEVGVDAHALLWLVFYKLLAVWADPADRVWVRTTALGRSLLRGGGS